MENKIVASIIRLFKKGKVFGQRMKCWKWLIIWKQWDETVKKEYSASFISEIISMAWADDISFDKIKNDAGLSENEVIKIMRSNLKPGSFKLWRKRVSGRNSKHDKKKYLIIHGAE